MVFWSNARWALGIAAGVAAGAGWMSAWLTPRGPITTAQILISMAAALGFGVVVGLITGSRWGMLAIPVLYVATFELARRGTDGPTVDGIHLTSTYGLIAFVLGRVAHALFVLGPLILGIVYGRWFAHRLGHAAIAPLRPVGWIGTGAATLLLVVVAGAVARPARTAPILGADGTALSGGIAEVIAIPIGGHQQTLMIRGARTTSPVLLYLAGGPGGTDLGAMRADSGLEQAFVVVVWEQRGTGKSYAALDPVDTMTLEQMLADTIEVSRYLRNRFGQDKIYLVGNSWGTILGTRAVQQHPELFHAYVGTGQMVSPRETDRMFYEDTVTWATQTGDTTLAATLRRNGPPPYANLLAYEAAIAHEHDWNPYAALDVSKEMPSNLFVPENSLVDRINGLRGFLDTFAVLYPQLQEIDFRRDVPALAVPVYIILGKHEARGRAVLAYEWFDLLTAPSKELIIFDHSGHRPVFEEPMLFASVMARVVDETSTNEP